VINTLLSQIIKQDAKEISFPSGGNNKVEVVTDISATDEGSRSFIHYKRGNANDFFSLPHCAQT
jgi:hypothetical protein